MTAMDTITHELATLLSESPVVFLHLVSATGALLLGGWLLARRKGTPGHRRLGWAWALLMGSAAVSSGFIRSDLVPALGGLSPIHLLTALVLVMLPRGIWLARQGRQQAHRQTMRGLYLGGCLIAGMFTLLPGRFLGHWLWHHALGVTA